jgi:hypothetical protein
MTEVVRAQWLAVTLAFDEAPLFAREELSVFLNASDDPYLHGLGDYLLVDRRPAAFRGRMD